MKMTVSGVQRMAGTSKAGNQFDMCQLFALVPIENRTGKITTSGHGLHEMEIPMDAAALPHFANLKFPITLELEMEPRPRNGRVETVVTGIVAAKG